MADLKNYSSVSELNIHISFHLVGDNTFNTQKKYVEHLIFTMFGASFSLEHEDVPTTSDCEVVYALQRPIIGTPDEQKKYFENLKALFSKAERFLPSFTQGLEVK